jgi:hypothetical protein
MPLVPEAGLMAFGFHFRPISQDDTLIAFSQLQANPCPQIAAYISGGYSHDGA